MSKFTVIPVLDLKGGLAVHAVAGRRADYAPIMSPFGSADDPVAIARGLLAATASPALYVADLDAIEGIGNHFELLRGLSYSLPDITLWVDAGFSNVADCAFWLPLGATLVIGSESLEAVDDWRDIRAAFGDSVVLSLDRGSEGERGPEPLFSDPDLWPSRLVAIDLSRVGTGDGPDLDQLRTILDMTGGSCAVFSGGGVRNTADLDAIKAMDAAGALIATALHTNAITENEIAALG